MKNAQLQITLPEDIYDRIKNLAIEEHRSISSMGYTIVLRGLEIYDTEDRQLRLMAQAVHDAENQLVRSMAQEVQDREATRIRSMAQEALDTEHARAILGTKESIYKV